jgi:AcrR family transcriptional regulator
VLRDADKDRTLREHLIGTVAALIASGHASGLTVRDIARAGGVADGALYNHFSDKEELLALALHRHVGTVMESAHRLPEPGSATVEENLRAFVRGGIDMLTRVTPAFAAFLSQPEVIVRLREQFAAGHPPAVLPQLLADYLTAERELGRVAADADPTAAATLLIGACHDLTLPRLLFDPDGGDVVVPDTVVDALVATVLRGIAVPPGR